MRVTQEETPATGGGGVSVRRVVRTFPGGVRAIDRLSLDVGAGEFVAVLGPSGCGKSTLLRIVAGLDRADDGEVVVPPCPMAYVFQDAHLLPWRNVLRNVALPLELQGVGRSEREGRAGAAIEQVGLGEFARRYPGQLSGGMRMRVSLARALVTDPRVLLMDEPFAALDEITRQRLDEMLRGLWRARGMTVLFVTHSIPEATYLSQRAVVLTRRPARVVVDHPIGLGDGDRPASVRGEAAFARETRVLYEALERGEMA